jgi:uncharacterized protein YbjT (DUF2867 family)
MGRATSLVLGASGFVGRALVDALLTDGETVRAASRHPPKKPPAPRLDFVVCDVGRPETLPRALHGVETVYYLVHSIGAQSGDFRRLECASAENLASAAGAAGCGRIVYLGGVAPLGAPSKHLASRLAVGEILRAGRVPAIELRAAMIIGNGSVSWKIVRDLGLRLPVMLLPKWLESRSCPVALRDVIRALIEARRVPLERGEWFDLPGPEVLSARAMLAQVSALHRRKIPMVRVPVLTPRLSALWLKLVTGADYAIARELVLGLACDLLPVDARYWDLIGRPELMTFEAAAKQALATEAPPSVAARLEERLVGHLGRAGRSGHP